MTEELTADLTTLGYATCGWCGAGVDRFVYCRDATSKYVARVETYTCGARRWYWWIDKDGWDMPDPANPCTVALSKQFLNITNTAREQVAIADRKVQEARDEP